MNRTEIGGMAVIEWRDAGDDAPWLHFAHATGMCAEIYVALLEPLAGEINIVVSDARGHGRSTLPADPAELRDWRTYEHDLAELLATYGAPSWRLAGHSMGASVSLEVAARNPGLATSVVIVEPAFIAFDRAEAWTRTNAAGDPSSNPMAQQAARRRSVFASRDAARDNWRGRGVFASWPDAALDAYVDGGMRDRPDGQVELACTPAWEAATFAAVTSTLEQAATNWTGGLTLIHGTVGSTVAQADADAIAALRPDARVERIEGANHFLPLEHADRVRAAIRAAVS